MTPPTAPERCPTCDKPRAGDVEASHKEGCTCAACLAVCWRDWGVMCEEAPWRARAIAAESAAAQWAKVAPLIERLREAFDSDDALHEIAPAALAIVAATEATP